MLDIEFLDPKPVTDRQRVRSLEVKEVGLQIERVCQAVRRVDAHDQRAIERGKFDASGGGQARLAHTALAREHEDPHTPLQGLDVRRSFVRKELKIGRTEAISRLSEPGDPDLPAIEPKIQNADDDPCAIATVYAALHELHIVHGVAFVA